MQTEGLGWVSIIYCLYEFISALRADINSIRGLRPLMIPQVGLRPTVTFHGLKEAPGVN